MSQSARVAIVTFCMLATAAALRAQAKPEARRSGHSRTINVATEQFSGEKMRGPATLTLKNVNVLRYDVRVGTSVTYANGPDLRLPFIPPIPSTPQPGRLKITLGAPGGVTTGTRETLAEFLERQLGELESIEDDRYSRVQQPIVETVRRTNAASDAIKALVGASDAILQFADGPQRLVEQVTKVLGDVEAARKAPAWPYNDVENLLKRLAVVRNEISAPPEVPAGQNKMTYDQIVVRTAALQILLEGVNYASAAAAGFRDTGARVEQWGTILASVKASGPAAFEMNVPIGCSFAFSGEKESKVEIVRHDRLVAPGADDSRQQVLTVVCSSPLTVTAGFGFSSMDESVPALVQSKKTVNDPVTGQAATQVVSEFGYSNRSSFRPLPVVLLNTRAWEPSDLFALDLSAGAAVDVATGQSGTDLELVLGPTASFNRTFFLTLATHVGRVTTLAGGFSEGDEVPSGVSAPPVRKTWKTAVAVLATWKIH